MEQFVETIEPYSSYRYVLALVLFGLTTWLVVSSILSLRGMRQLMLTVNRQMQSRRLLDDVRIMLDPDHDLSQSEPYRANTARIAKLAMLRALLRQFGWKTLRAVWLELVLLAALSLACVWAYNEMFFG